jgi:hypothetical protein
VSKAQEIADEVVAKRDAELAWPKLMHMSADRRNDKYFLPFCQESESAKNASMVETYAAADIIRLKYSPQYNLGPSRAHTFS